MSELYKVAWYYNLIYDYSNNQKIVCPFHEDVNPSLVLNFEENKWFCFGCNRSGDAKDFVKEFEKKYNGLNNLKAYLKYLRILKSKKCSDLKLKLTRSKKAKKQDIDLYNEAYDFYFGLKTINWGEVDDKEIRAARKYMLNRGFTVKVLNQIKAKYTYQSNYKIVFPMFDNGEFKGWVCRTTDPEIEKKRKYLYNTGFSRATTLVGEYGLKDYVIVVEGYMDRLKLVQFGINNVVAILGWKMSNEQIKKLKSKGIKTIISALDNDECGKKGTKFLKQHFKVVRWQFLKGVKDTGEMDKDMFKKMYSKTFEIFKEKEKTK